MTDDAIAQYAKQIKRLSDSANLTQQATHNHPDPSALSEAISEN